MKSVSSTHAGLPSDKYRETDEVLSTFIDIIVTETSSDCEQNPSDIAGHKHGYNPLEHNIERWYYTC